MMTGGEWLVVLLKLLSNDGFELTLSVARWAQCVAVCLSVAGEILLPNMQ